MKRNLPFSFALALIVLFSSCTTEYSDFQAQNNEELTLIVVSNWTGHWRNCSPGETLIFSVTAKNKTQEFTLGKDSGASYREELEEGDILHIAVMKPNRDIIHSRSKTFMPSDPEKPSPDGNSLPVIEVCNIDKLDLYGF